MESTKQSQVTCLSHMTWQTHLSQLGKTLSCLIVEPMYQINPSTAQKTSTHKLSSSRVLSQVNEEGFSLTVFNSILEYTKDDSLIEKKDLYFKTRSGTKRLRKTTCGWNFFLVLWKDGSETWVPLKDMKESHPIEIAGFAKSRGIDKEPAFSWWIPYTLQKRDIIISAINTLIRRTTHKYGI